MNGKLYLCPTPIGNLEDITLRVLRVLKEADLIAAEDTRHSLKLLNHFSIKKPMISYFEHNKRQRGEEITAFIEQGKTVALVTDAGTPAISDPGECLVALCIEKGIEVISLPGPSAAITALVVSGRDAGRFSFQGFLTTNKRGRKEHLEQIKHHPETLIFYEAPHKLKSTLSEMAQVLGDREISLCRELTKIHEQIIRTTLCQAAQMYIENAPKGEFVLVIDGCKQMEEQAPEVAPIEVLYDMYMAQGINSKEALKLAAKAKQISKREAYDLLKR